MIPTVPVSVVVIMAIVMIVAVPPLLRERNILAVAVTGFLPMIANLIRSHESIAVLPLAGPIAMVGITTALVVESILPPILVAFYRSM